MVQPRYSRFTNRLKRHKRDVDKASDWKAGLRGVLYREIRNNVSFRRIQETRYGILK